MKGYIYKYTFSDGKFYIGQTRRNPEIRHREHLSPIIGPANTGFWDAYQRLGEPTYEVIETIENESVTDLIDLLNKRETYWIKYYEADKSEKGYNKMSHGTVTDPRNAILDDAYRKVFQIIYDAKCEEYLPIRQKVGKNQPLTPEEQMIWDEYQSKNVYPMISDDEFFQEEADQFVAFIMIADSEEAAEEYVKENAFYILSEYWSENAILQLDQDNNICRVFTSFNDIAQCFGVKRPDNVRNVLHKRQQSAYGFNWCYAKDYSGDKSKLLDLFYTVYDPNAVEEHDFPVFGLAT